MSFTDPLGGILSALDNTLDNIILAGLNPYSYRDGRDRIRSEKEKIDSFLSKLNKEEASKPTKAESTRTHHPLDDDDLSHTIIPSEKIHHLTEGLIQTFGSKVAIRPSLVTYSESESLLKQQLKFDKWLEYPSKIESEDTFIYLGCDEYTAAVIFKGWERLGNEYAEKVDYRKQNRILKLMYEFAIVVIEKESFYNKNLPRPLGLTSENIGKNYDLDCPRIVDLYSQLRKDAAQRELFELKSSELEGVHRASILRVLKAHFGACTPEFEEALQYYLPDGLPSAGRWTTDLAMKSAYKKAFPSDWNNHNWAWDDELESASSSYGNNVRSDSSWPQSAEHNDGGGRDNLDENLNRVSAVDLARKNEEDGNSTTMPEKGSAPGAAELDEQIENLTKTASHIGRNIKEAKRLLNGLEEPLGTAGREWINSVISDGLDNVKWIESNVTKATNYSRVPDLLSSSTVCNQSLTTVIAVLYSTINQTNYNKLRRGICGVGGLAVFPTREGDFWWLVSSG